VHAGYAAEVAYVDRHLGRLLDALEAKGVLDSGIVVFTSDHGEEFWEHGGLEHGHSHHAEVLDVPLLLVAPGLAPGPRGGVASLVDVVPTIRAALGDAPDGSESDGARMRPFFRAWSPDPDAMIQRLAEARVIVVGDARWAATAAKALRAAGARVYLAGRPAQAEALKAAGVETFVFSGCDALAVLQAAHDLIAR
jgi:arylsulfatase A-like enzyme